MHSSAKKNHMIHQVNNKRNQTVIGVGQLTFEGGRQGMGNLYRTHFL